MCPQFLGGQGSSCAPTPVPGLCWLPLSMVLKYIVWGHTPALCPAGYVLKTFPSYVAPCHPCPGPIITDVPVYHSHLLTCLPSLQLPWGSWQCQAPALIPIAQVVISIESSLLETPCDLPSFPPITCSCRWTLIHHLIVPAGSSLRSALPKDPLMTHPHCLRCQQKEPP